MAVKKDHQAVGLVVLCTIVVHIVENRALFAGFSVIRAAFRRSPSTMDPFLWRGAYSSSSSSLSHSAADASLGILLVGAKSALLRFRLLPCASSPHKIFDFAGTPFWRLAGEAVSYSSPSSSLSHSAADASLGIRQSPRGERATVPTLGPSGRQERLNCWEKKRR